MGKKKEMPSIEKLREMIGVKHNSVSYGDNRTVLNNIHKPVIAYGLGFAGMYVVFVNGNGFLMAYTYSVKHMGSEYPDAGFSEIPIDTALKSIRENELFTFKSVDEEALEKARERKKFVRPVVGEFIYEETYKNWNRQNSTNKKAYIVERFKNGKHKIISRQYFDRGNGDIKTWDHTSCVSSLLQAYENAINEKDDNGYKYKLVQVSEGFNELITILKMEAAAEAI